MGRVAVAYDPQVLTPCSCAGVAVVVPSSGHGCARPGKADVVVGGWEKIPSYPAVEAVVVFSLVVLAGDRFRGVFRVAVSVAPLAAGTWLPSSPKLLPWVGRACAVADVDCTTTPVIGGSPAVDDWFPA